MKIGFVECGWQSGKPLVALNHVLAAWYDATGLVAPLGNNTSVFGVFCVDTVATAIESDVDVIVHTDDNKLLQFVVDNESQWQNELEVWLNG